MKLNCFPNICVYIHRYDLHSTLVKETSPCTGQWLIQKLVTTLKVRISDSECLSGGVNTVIPNPSSPGTLWNRGRKYIKPGG